MKKNQTQIDINLSTNLQKLRKINNLKQEDIANILGVDRSTSSNWERGASTPSPENLTILAKIYNVSIDFLLNDNSLNIAVGAPKLQSVPGESFVSELNDEERMLLIRYRALNDESKSKINEQLLELNSNR